MFNVNAFDAAIVLRGSDNAEAARVMGINPATLARKKSGESDFYRREIDAFCEFYSVSPDDIFFASNSA